MDIDLPDIHFDESMDIKPLTNEQIARNEKKMNMTLDDIINMSKSKNTTSNSKKPRASNKCQKFLNNGAARGGNVSNVRPFMVSRSTVRQGVLAQRRSNIQNNQFQLITAISSKAAEAPIRSRSLIYNRMVDSSKPRRRVTSDHVWIKEAKHIWMELQSHLQVSMNILSVYRVVTSPLQKKTTEANLSHCHKKAEVKVVTKKANPKTFNSFCAFMNEQNMRVASLQPSTST